MMPYTTERRRRDVLILTSQGDTHAEAVAQRLVARDAKVHWFDYGRLPSKATMLFETGGRPGRARVHVGSDMLNLNLADVGVVWTRRPSTIVASAPTGEQVYVKQETAGYMLGLFDAAHCPWFPGTAYALRKAEGKIEQLWRAERRGFLIPPTLITNRPEEALAFYNEHQGEVISKVGESLGFEHSYPGLSRYTERVRRRDLRFLHGVRHCPVLFQALVAKRLELRVTVVGERVFTAAIHSQESRQTQLDWRKYDTRNTPHQVHELPPPVERNCVALVKELGLTYGAIDLILRPDGEYVFLEINPNGQYLWIETLTGLPISDAIADHLVELAHN